MSFTTRHFPLIFVLTLLATALAAEPEGPRAFFGFVTHYETSAAGRGEVKVLQVVPGGPAERAGLRAGDVIVAFNGVAFRFADEYEYMRSLAVFESGRELKLAIERGGRKVEAPIVPEQLAPAQVEALAGYMAQLGSCMKTGQNCPCPLAHGHDAADPDEFVSPYRRFTSAVSRQGGKTVLTIGKDAEGRLSYRSSPVPLPPDFAIGPAEDGLLWQQLQQLAKGASLEVEIAADGSGGLRVRILGR